MSSVSPDQLLASFGEAIHGKDGAAISRAAALYRSLCTLEIANFYNPAFWSLPPEVEYYLLLPLLAWFSVRARQKIPCGSGLPQRLRQNQLLDAGAARRF